METHQTLNRQEYSQHHKAEFLIIILGIFLLPFIRFSLSNIPVVADKDLLVVVVSVGALMAWLLGRLVDNKISFPRSSILYGLGLIWLTQLLASAFSVNPAVSFAGTLFSPDSFIFFSSLFIIALISSLVFQSLSRVVMLYLAFYAGVFMVFIVQSIGLFSGVDFWGLFSTAPLSLLGGWYDLAVLFGLALLIALVFVEYFPSGAFFRRMGWLAIIVSILGLIYINFTLLWWFIGVISLILIFFPCKSKFAITPTIIVVISLLCIFLGRAGGPIQNLMDKLGPVPVDVRPSWQGTYGIAIQSLKEYPLLGVGPGLFSREWVKYKDRSVNSTAYWDVDFNNGVGYIPSQIVSSGLLGALAWFIFLVILAKQGFRALITLFNKNPREIYFLAITVAMLYLWTSLLIYSVGPVILMFTFIFTGLFVAYKVFNGTTNSITISFSIYPKLKMPFTFLIVVLGLIGIAVGYGRFENYRALRALNQSFDFETKGNVPEAINTVNKAISYDGRDVYHRHASDMYFSAFTRASSVLSSGNEEEIRTIAGYFGSAVFEAQKAISYDPTNYLNYLKLGNVYESVVSVKISGAYDEAKVAYQKSFYLNPNSPAIPYVLARLEVIDNNVPKAIEYLNQSLSIKPNYSPARYFLGLAYLKMDKQDLALVELENAFKLDPDNNELKEIIDNVKVRSTNFAR